MFTPTSNQSDTPGITPQHDPLDVFFAPQTIAVFGATETPGTVGRTLVSNLIHNPFGGTVYPVNPRQGSVHGIRAYPDLAAVPNAVELAVIATPAATVPDRISECVAAGVKGGIILSAGFGESGPGGVELERQIRERLRNDSLRVVGPNSLGITYARTGLNATFAPAMPPPGNVAFLSQSGALLTALLNKESRERVGCSAFVSVGSLLDVSWAEWINYLGNDPGSKCLGLYVETLDNSPAFFAALRKVTPNKPVVLLKAGKAETGGGDRGDEVFDEACRCNGVLRVRRVADLFRMAATLTTQPTPRGSRLTIVTNARGPGLLATDALHADGGHLAPLSPKTVAELSLVLPTRWNRQNPIDLGDDADAGRFTCAATIALENPDTDALLILLTPHATIDPVRTAQDLGSLARAKPILACWMAGAANPESLTILREAGIPTVRSPDAAIRLFGHLWRHGENMRCVSELLAMLANTPPPDVNKQRAAEVIAGVRRSGRPALTAAEARQLLSAYGLPTAEIGLADSAEEAVVLAAKFGYPVVLGLASDRGRREREPQGIELQAFDAATTRRAFRALEMVAREYYQEEGSPGVLVRPLLPHDGFEMVLRSIRHPAIGPILQFGVGGRWVMLARDRLLAMPALGLQVVSLLLDENQLFKGPREAGVPEPHNVAPLQEFLAHLGRLVAEQPAIKDLTIARLLVSADRVTPLDVSVVLQEDEIPEYPLSPSVADTEGAAGRAARGAS